MNEFSRIARYFAPLAGEGAFGLTDDAALLTPPAGAQLVTTCDSVIAGIHCIGDESASMLAHKLMRRNLSDIAAMGASAYAYLVSLMLPRDTPESWFKDFAHGLAQCQDMFGITLLGGDTAATTGPLSLSLTAFGTLTTPPLLRSGAQMGDGVYVTGTLGDAALGLDMLQGKLTPDAALIARYHYPEPRLSVASTLHGIAHSCMDISDGLLQDASHIAASSNVGLSLRADALPLSDSARRLYAQSPALLRRIVSGGDDYELLFTAPMAHENSLHHIAEDTGVTITRIGTVEAGEGVTLCDANGEAIRFREQGFTHF